MKLLISLLLNLFFNQYIDQAICIYLIAVIEAYHQAR